MVKLASARELSFYGPIPFQHTYEFINACLYVVAAVLMLLGFVLLQQKPWLTNPRLGLVILMVAMLLIITLNVHDLWAHLSGFDIRFSPIIHLESQLPFVEFAVPILHAIGAVLVFVGFLLTLLQLDQSVSIHKSYVHILLIAGPAFWVLGSIYNAFEGYIAGSIVQLQVLQKGAYLSFLIGSILFLISTIVHSERPSPKVENTWLDILAGVMFVTGGLFNLVKVLKHHYWLIINGCGLQEREGQHLPLLSGERSMKKTQAY